jgi:hypothetical protein
MYAWRTDRVGLDLDDFAAEGQALVVDAGRAAGLVSKCSGMEDTTTTGGLVTKRTALCVATLIHRPCLAEGTSIEDARVAHEELDRPLRTTILGDWLAASEQMLSLRQYRPAEGASVIRRHLECRLVRGASFGFVGSAV